MTTIRPSTEQDHAEIVGIVNSINLDRIAQTVERFRIAIGSQPPAAHAQSYVAEDGRQIVGHLWLNRLLYVPGPDVWYVELVVAPAAQGQGIGTQLYQFLQNRLAEHGAQRIYAQVREDLPVARSFAAHRGFRETGHGDRPSRLHAQTANLEPGRHAAERLAQEGIRITTEQELGPDDEGVLRCIHQLFTEIYADIPSSEALNIPFDEWRQLRVEEGDRPATTWVAMDADRVVGTASLRRVHPASAYVGYTGVARSHRGRGIARALKYYQTEYAQQHHISYLFTDNDVENAAMLHINTDMGYRPLPASLEIVKDLNVADQF